MGVLALMPKTEVRALAIAAMARHFGTDAKKDFDAIDKDRSGTISRKEFARYYVGEVLQEYTQSEAQPPSKRQLALHALNTAIPMVVFGFLDNSIMIVGGDV